MTTYGSGWTLALLLTARPLAEMSLTFSVPRGDEPWCPTGVLVPLEEAEPTLIAESASPVPVEPVELVDPLSGGEIPRDDVRPGSTGRPASGASVTLFIALRIFGGSCRPKPTPLVAPI
jgi:hypothetical protein